MLENANERIDKVATAVKKNANNAQEFIKSVNVNDPNGFDSLVSDAEWAVLGADEHSEDSLAAKKHEQWMKRQQEAQQRDVELEMACHDV